MLFLLIWRGIHNDFRESEFYSVVARLRGLSECQCAADLNIRPCLLELPTSSPHSSSFPVDTAAGTVLYGHIYCFVDLRSTAEARKICSRCLLVRALLLPLGHGADYDTCIQSVARPEAQEACADMVVGGTFKCAVEAFGRRYTMAQQLERMERFGAVLFDKFNASVNLKSPDAEFWIAEDAFPSLGHRMDIPITDPRQVFLGRVVACGMASLGHTFHLRERRVLGPTSTNAELSFVMCNVAHIGPGSVVVDPFCGTGSILVSAAAMGAVVVGSDIDVNVLRGKVGCGIAAAMDANFEQYGLPRPLGVIRADVFATPFCERPWADAVVCDPPYGVREGARAMREDVGIDKSKREFVPGSERVRMVDMVGGLIQFAAARLVAGGRLVYWLPTTTDYTDADIPRSDQFRLVSNCDQALTMRMHRRLITMVRLSTKEEADAKEREIREGRSFSDISLQSHVPAHDDFSAKVLRQPLRSETRMKPKTLSLA